MRNLFFVLALAATTFTGCGYLWNKQGDFVRQIDPTELTRIIITYSEKLKYEKNGLRLEDSVIVYEQKIKRIRLDYSSMDALNVWDARDLLVDIVEGLLGIVNENILIYRDLALTPMTARDLEIYITFPSYYNAYVDLHTVGLITLRGGIVNYIASDALDCDTSCWHRRSEYYYQSKNFVEFRRQGEALYKPRDDSRLDKVFEEEQHNTLKYQYHKMQPAQTPHHPKQQKSPQQKSSTPPGQFAPSTSGGVNTSTSTIRTTPM